MSYIKAPKPEHQVMYDYLEDLRKSGDTNMFGAGKYLQAHFGLSRDKATTILSDWMRGHSDKSRVLSGPTAETREKPGRLVTRYEV